MDFDREWARPIVSPLDFEVQVFVQTGGQPVRSYTVMLQIRLDGKWRTIRLIDNHLDWHHMHRYDGYTKLDGELFYKGPVLQAIPMAIDYMIASHQSIILSWSAPPKP